MDYGIWALEFDMVGADLLESATFDKIIQIQAVMWNNISN